MRTFVRCGLPALVLLPLAVGGCLPRGNPPAGRQVLFDRTASLLNLVPSTGDGLVRALLFRPGKTPDLVDLSVLTVDERGGAPSERVLATDIAEGIELGCRPAGTGCFPTDSRGRLYVNREGSEIAGGGGDLEGGGSFPLPELVRVDPITGEAVILGAAWSASMSDNRQRVLVRPSRSDVGSKLLEIDDTSVVLDDVRPSTFAVEHAAFTGNTVFYLNATDDLVRVAPGGAPERLAKDVSTFLALSEQLVLLVRGPKLTEPEPSVPGSVVTPPDPDLDVATLLDTTTLQEEALPAGFDYRYGTSFSSDLRWIVLNGSGGLVLYDRRTGTVEPLEQEFSFAGAWRPGHDELWASSLRSDVAGKAAWTLSIKKPGQPVVTLPGVGAAYLPEFGSVGLPFTADGAYWFEQDGDPNTAGPTLDRVGLADDPTGPTFPLAPPLSSATRYWRLADGRFLVTSIAGSDMDYFGNLEVQVVDPRNGAARVLGQRGFVDSVGRTRMLGVFHIAFERGDLTSVDLITGQSTILAPEFAAGGVAEAQGADPYPPGGRVFYQFRARFDSPWDGFWLATVP